MKVLSGDRTKIPFQPYIASQPAMRLIGPGPQWLETAQQKELGSSARPGKQRRRVLTSARQ